nr:hypothetical protein CFP56_37782 [Quercus suber]POF09234.1 hypothetical protein CFP56_18107 [Quercus suber]
MMPVPLTPHISIRDPPIRRHESEYMPAPLGLAGSWGYAPLDDWARGPVLDQVPFHASRYALGSPVDRIDPFTVPTAGDDVNDGNAGHFTDNAIRDDDSP